jgi:DMSO/TMAO reductase YedYZ molybdopterin-dependent catalytic subunit
VAYPIIIQEANKTKKTLTLCLILLSSTLILTIPHNTSAAPQWTIQLTTLNGATTDITYDQLIALPKTTVTAEIFCYGIPITGGTWGGVVLSELLNQTGLDPGVASLSFAAQDGYKVSIPIADALRSDVIIAYEKDGSPLTETLRLVVPYANGNMWINMVTSITMSSSAATLDPAQIAATVKTPMDNNAQLIQQQNNQPTQPTPTPYTQTPSPAPSNSTISLPTASPTNTNQPPNQSIPENTTFPTAIIYAAALGAVVALVITSFIVYRTRQHKA